MIKALMLASLAWANPVDEGVRSALKWEDPVLAAKISDYGVGATVVGAYAYTLNRENGGRKAGALTAAYLTNLGVNQAVKRLTSRERPNRINRASFFSGHTSTAFVGAGAMCLQDRDVCLASLLVAGSIGYLRIAADWHWFTDVAVGAGVGYASGRYIPTIIVIF